MTICSQHQMGPSVSIVMRTRAVRHIKCRCATSTSNATRRTAADCLILTRCRARRADVPAERPYGTAAPRPHGSQLGCSPRATGYRRPCGIPLPSPPPVRFRRLSDGEICDGPTGPDLQQLRARRVVLARAGHHPCTEDDPPRQRPASEGRRHLGGGAGPSTLTVTGPVPERVTTSCEGVGPGLISRCTTCLGM